jgi:iron complex transport system substrate-binding protein
MDTPSMLTLKLVVLLILTVPVSLMTVSTAHANGGFPLSVIDDFGRNVTIRAPATRIVSTAPSNTEILFAVGAGNNVVGVTSYCDYPPVVPEKVKKKEIAIIGGYADPSFEGVVALNPDLVLAATDLQYEFVSALQNRGVVVVALNPKTLNDIIRDLALVGTICGNVSEANRLVENLQHRFNYVSERIAGTSDKPKLYYELWYDPLMSFGSNTLADELITKAGGTNLFHDAPTMYPTVDSEMVIQKDPEIIVVSVGYMGGVSKTDFEKRAGWSNITAVKEGKIYTIDENLIVRQGPRVCDGLENLASILHPELFTGTIHYNSSIAIASNSSVFAVIYDDARSQLNFSIIGRGTSASIRVNIEKRFLKGSPIVLVDGVETTPLVSENQTAFAVNFTTTLSTHKVVVGGSQTIPEFSQHSAVGILLVAVTAVLMITISMSKLHRKRQLVRC